MGVQPEDKKPEKYITAGLLAHVDAGKTTLCEGILYLTGSIRRLGRVDNGDAFLDTDRLERDRGITIFSKQAQFRLGELETTLLDTPGHVDFSAEMERTLQVLDYAVLVISGADGVQGHTQTLWQLLKRCQIPVFLFINKMDQPGTDSQALMEQLKSRLDGSCVNFNDPEETVWENAALCDETLLEQYLEQGKLESEQMRELIRKRRLFPCYFGSALKLKGVEELLKGIETYVCPPVYGSEFRARVYKISRDSQGNRLTHLKILGGSLKVKETLTGEEKVNQIRVYSGERFETISEAEAGMICAVTGPCTTYPGQGIGLGMAPEKPMLEAVLTYQVILPEGCDAHKMLKNLQQLEEEDPQLHVGWNEALGEIQLQVMGQVQIEILKSVIEERFGVCVDFGTGSIVYKETISRAVEGVGHFEPLRHYAEVHLLMEPLERGSGLELAADCSEDQLDRNWQRLILTHLAERSHRGVLTGSEITDMRITLIAGRAHLKHTEGGDFRQATYRAVRQGLMEAGCRLLEPWYSFRLEVPEECLGRAMSDMERLQGRFEPPLHQEGVSILTGQVPASTVGDYQMEVASYTRGRGHFSISFKGYEDCHNQEEVAASMGYNPEEDLDNPSASVFCAHGAGYLVPWDQVKEHMQVESPLTQAREEPARPEPSTGPSRANPSMGSALGSWSDDQELEEIFRRRFGEPKDRKRAYEGPRQIDYSRKRQPKEEELPEYLLVDGYNIIFAWEELRELSKVTIDGARHRLMDILCNYQGYKKCTLIVVFDAYKVEGNMGQALDYHNIHVVYTKEAETADQYIEKLAHRIGRQYQVTVATSDGLEQLIIYGQGCHLMSARDLKEEVDWVNEQIRQERDQLVQRQSSGKSYLFRDTDEELVQYLEEVRLGRRNSEDRNH